MNNLSIHSAVEGSDNWCEDLAVAHAQSMDERMACRSVLSIIMQPHCRGEEGHLELKTVSFLSLNLYPSVTWHFSTYTHCVMYYFFVSFFIYAIYN